MKRKRYVLAFGLALFLLTSCATTRTAQDLTTWYTKNTTDYPNCYSSLFYRGSDKQYHYFTCRAFDNWIKTKVKREDISIEDVRPLIGLFGEPFPGHYAVEPANGYKCLEQQ